MGRDQAVIAVIGGLSESQAVRLSSQIQKAKNKCAPGNRGTIVSGSQDKIGSYLQGGHKRIGR